MKRTPDNTKSKLKILATITSQLAALCEELAAENDGNEDPIVDKTNVKAETGEEPRPFQEAARRGDFPNWKTAHGRAAKKSDVMAWRKGHGNGAGVWLKFRRQTAAVAMQAREQQARDPRAR